MLFQNGDSLEGIAATSGGYTTLKVFELTKLPTPTPSKKKRPVSKPTNKGKTMMSNLLFSALIFIMTFIATLHILCILYIHK